MRVSTLALMWRVRLNRVLKQGAYASEDGEYTNGGQGDGDNEHGAKVEYESEEQEDQEGW